MTHSFLWGWKVKIRDERSDDAEAIDRVVQDAFGRDDEARIVRALRQAGHLVLALVAEGPQGLLGHIAFSPLFEGKEPILGLAALAPVAVAPSVQGQGIGGMLIEEGLEAMRRRDTAAVVLLGHPAYYPRFGFRPAGPQGLSWGPHPPSAALMIRVLRDGPHAIAPRVFRFAPALETPPGPPAAAD